MVSKNNLLYIIGAIIYIACFGYIVLDMLQAPEGRILLFIFSTSVILTALIIVIGYKISKALCIYLKSIQESDKNDRINHSNLNCSSDVNSNI